MAFFVFYLHLLTFYFVFMEMLQHSIGSRSLFFPVAVCRGNVPSCGAYKLWMYPCLLYPTLCVK